MHGPSATNLCRGLTRAALRVTGSTCLVVAIVLAALTWRSFSIAQARAGVSAAPVPSIGEFFAAPFVVGIAGIWMLALDGVLLRRWLVPAAARGCSQCGYDLRGLNSGVCPECGTATEQPAATRT